MANTTFVSDPIPPLPRLQVVNPANGEITQPALQFMQQLWSATRNKTLAGVPSVGTSITYSIANTGGIIQRSNDTHNTMFDTLPTGLPSGVTLYIANIDRFGMLVIQSSDSQLDGVDNGILYIGPKQSVIVYTDGTDWFSFGKPSRTVLGNTTFLYVDNNGSDSNSGFSAAAPFLTLQKAYDLVQSSFDLNRNFVQIKAADGTYTTPLNALGPCIGGVMDAPYTPIRFVGNVNQPAKCVISPPSSTCVNVQGGGKISIQGFKLVSPTVGILCADYGSYVSANSLDFGTCGGAAQVYCSFGQVVFNGSYYVSGSCEDHFECAGGIIDMEGPSTGPPWTVTFLNAVTYTTFALARAGGIIDSKRVVFAGAAVTGQRYFADLNAIIHTQGGGANYFPGNAAGATGTGGQYD